MRTEDTPEEVNVVIEFIRGCGFDASAVSFGLHSWRICVSKDLKFLGDVMLGRSDEWAINMKGLSKVVMGHFSDPDSLDKIRDALRRD